MIGHTIQNLFTKQARFPCSGLVGREDEAKLQGPKFESRLKPMRPVKEYNEYSPKIDMNIVATL